MPRAETPETQIVLIRNFFADLIGAKLLKCETAELQHDDGTWSPWNDLPIRIFLGAGSPTAIAWSHFSRLWIESGSALPFSIDGSVVRWVLDSSLAVAKLNGSSLLSVQLGRGEMTIEERPIEIWTRLMFVFESGCLEVYNALDENGYAVHSEMPTGDFIKCV